jgi:hypothetical protein
MLQRTNLNTNRPTKPNPVEQKKAIDLRDHLNEISSMYTAQLAKGTFNMLLLGLPGVGKTHMISTARKPIMIHSFDPGGARLSVLQKLVKSGDAIIDERFEREAIKVQNGRTILDPQAYELWEKEFLFLYESDFFSQVGTFCIDSFSLWLQALKARIAVKAGRTDGLLQIQDWQVIGNVLRDMVKLCTAADCDFIMTGHVYLEKEEMSGRMLSHFYTIPSLRVDVPMLFDEIYVMEATETKDGIIREVITQPTGKIVARTRMGSEVFEVREKPDIMYLLKKAGKEV